MPLLANTTKFIIQTFLLFTILSTSLCVNAEPVTSASGNFIFYKDLTISVPTSPTDPTLIKLDANLRVPVGAENGETLYPAVVIITSWSSPLPDTETVADTLAENDYIVLTYTPRGFRDSEGIVEVSSTNDINDGKRVIDFLLNNHPVNPDAIGLSGTSYGGGISYGIATQDERVRAIVSRSSWSNLLESLAPGLSGRVDWMFGLLATGTLTGDLSPEIQENLDNILLQTNLSETIAWANERSPILNWDTVNAYKNPPAVYATSGKNDYLFQPDNNVKLIEKHQGPKRFDLQHGTHVVTQRIDPPETLQNLVAWFDHYLYGKANGIQCLKPVNYVVDANSFFKPPSESVNSFDDPLDYDTTRYHLSSNSNSNNAQMILTPHALGTQTLSYSTSASVVSSGIFIEQILGH